MIAGPYPMRTRCFLFCGGGTGGHLTPGLSVAEEVQRRLPDARLVFVGTGRGREAEWVERHGFEFRRLWASPWGGTPWRAARFAVRTSGGLLGALHLEKHMSPDAVIGLGGYGSLAPGLAAAIRRVPLALLEQNAYPGKANRTLSRWAQEVYSAWEAALPHFRHPDRVRVTGNPIRRALRGPRPRSAAEVFGLSPDKRTLLVMGGSQGAAAVNSAVAGAMDFLADCSPWLQVLHATGAVTYERVHEAYRRCPLQHAVVPFIDDMASAYAAADLVIGRAGGTSLAEVTAAGLPAVLVPLPIAANDHQSANARVLEEAGAALVVAQDDFTPARAAELVRGLFGHAASLDRMARASRSLGVPDAAERVVDRLLRLVQAPVAAVIPTDIRR